ncbi:MAG: phosphoribosyl-AMP cyclohydrolase [Pseudomonadota bacterium]
MTKAIKVTKEELEEGATFLPKFDANGLMACVVLDATKNDVLVVAFMNERSLELTLDTGEVHFWSRSRQALWKKGETSGNVLKVVEILTDCDQDALVIHAEPAGPTCHTGRTSCFYRRIEPGNSGAPTLVKVKT